MRISIVVLHFAALASTLFEMAIAIDTSCVHDDLEFTEASKKAHDVTKLHCGTDSCYGGEYLATDCQKLCQDADPRIGACTHFSHAIYKNSLLTLSAQCKLYNGEMANRKFLNSPIYDGRLCSGPIGAKRCTTFSGTSKIVRTGLAFCDGDKRKIQRTATAKWVIVAGPCFNEDVKGNLGCKYSYKVGIGKSNSNTKSSSTTAATEFSLTIGISATAGDPLDIAEVTTSMETSMGRSHSWTNEQSSTFEQSASTSETLEVSIEVEPGQVSTVCQPQGQVGNFVIYSSTFKRVSGYSCDNASDDSPDA